VFSGDPPNLLKVHLTVFVREDVARRNDRTPLHAGQCRATIRRAASPMISTARSTAACRMSSRENFSHETP